MADIERTAQATWTGDLRAGRGVMTTASEVLDQTPYSFRTRFGDEPGTNPEELIAAAHAACYSMALAHTLAQNGHTPERVTTQATCAMVRTDDGFRISAMRLEVNAYVPGLDREAFARLAEEADKGCPVSNLLRPGLKIERRVALDGR